MDEYIDKNAAVGILEAMSRSADCECIKKRLEKAAKRVSAIPAADVAPVVHGRWVERQAPHAMGGVSAKCSACGKSVQYLGNPLNYCPNCGAKMDGGTNDGA